LSNTYDAPTAEAEGWKLPRTLQLDLSNTYDAPTAEAEGWKLPRTLQLDLAVRA